MYISVEGADGAGKSTAVADLHQRLVNVGRRVIPVDKFYGTRPCDAPATVDENLWARFRELQPVTYGPFPEGRHLWGDHHWLFILGSWYSLLDEMVITPALAEGSVVVMDNAHYKTLARYMLKGGFPVDLAWHVFSHLRRPDLVVYLDVDPHVAMRRKGGFESIEAGFSGSDTEAFVSHQSALRAVLASFAARWSWEHIDTSELMPADVAEQVWSLVGARLPVTA